MIDYGAAVRRIPAHHEVEGDLLGLRVGVEAVHLDDIRVVVGQLEQHLADGADLSPVAGVDGVDAHRVQDDPMLVHHGHLHGTGEGVHLARRHVLIDLHVHAARETIWAIVMQHEVVDALDARHLLDRLLDALGELVIHALTQDVADGLAQDVNTALDDDDGDDCAQPCLEAHAGCQKDARGDQGRGGDDRVHERIGARGHKRVRVVLLPTLLGEEPQHDLGHDGNRHHAECDAVVAGRLGMDDALRGLGERGHARPRDDGGDDDGGDVLGAAMPVGVLAIRWLVGQVRAHDGDDRRERVGEVVDCVEHDGDGVGEQPDGRLEACQQHVGQYTYGARTYNGRVSVDHGCVLTHLSSPSSLIPKHWTVCRSGRRHFRLCPRSIVPRTSFNAYPLGRRLGRSILPSRGRRTSRPDVVVPRGHPIAYVPLTAGRERLA